MSTTSNSRPTCQGTAVWKLERGVGDEQLTLRVVLALIGPRVSPGKSLLSLHRTNWDDGKCPMTLLVSGAVRDGSTSPLVCDASEHTGKSDTHMGLVRQLLRVFPTSR